MLCLTFSLMLSGCETEEAENDGHGKVTKLEAYWAGSHWDGRVIQEGDFYVSCTATYEDGTTEDVDDWTMKEPVTIPANESVSFYVYYGGKKAQVTVPLDKYSGSSGSSSGSSGGSSGSRSLTRAQRNAMLAQSLKEQYPGHEHDYYVDLLMNEGLTQEEAEEALSAAA